jgi:hypothetical protein
VFLFLAIGSCDVHRGNRSDCERQSASGWSPGRFVFFLSARKLKSAGADSIQRSSPTFYRSQKWRVACTLLLGNESMVPGEPASQAARSRVAGDVIPKPPQSL